MEWLRHAYILALTRHPTRLIFIALHEVKLPAAFSRGGLPERNPTPQLAFTFSDHTGTKQVVFTMMPEWA